MQKKTPAQSEPEPRPNNSIMNFFKKSFETKKNLEAKKNFEEK